MNRIPLQLCNLQSLLLLVFVVSSSASAADAPTALTVAEAEVYLYARQAEQSDKIARLEKGEELTPLAQAVGLSSWYLVRTQKGLVGWVKSSDVTASDRAETLFTDSTTGKISTWTALTNNGRAFSGTWAAEIAPSTDEVTGTWTLRDGQGKTVMRGTWSAGKFSTGWHGSWRALAAGRSHELAGTWTADLSIPGDARFAELFQAAAREAVRGIWSGGRQAGSWAIRAAD